jgi:hypothetical protein
MASGTLLKLSRILLASECLRADPRQVSRLRNGREQLECVARRQNQARSRAGELKL